MQIIESAADLRSRAGSAPPPCVLVGPGDHGLLTLVEDRLELREDRHWLAGRPMRRPHVHVVDDGRVSVVALLPDESGSDVVAVTLLASPRGLLVIAGDPALGPIRDAVALVGDDPVVGLVAALVGVARTAEAATDELAESVSGLQGRSGHYTSGSSRSAIGDMRSRLFALAQLLDAHRRLTSHDDELAAVVPARARSLLRHATTTFAASADMAQRLYALLGDALDQQRAAVSERLTLVSTVFLPLTLATGFFGMNFGWMTDHIGSLRAFVLLGLVSPVLLLAVTLVAVRVLTTTGDPLTVRSAPSAAPADQVRRRAS